MKLVSFLSLAGLSLVDAAFKVDCMTGPDCPCEGNSCNYWSPPGQACVSDMVLAEVPDKNTTLGSAMGKDFNDAMAACLSPKCGGKSVCEWGNCPWDNPEGTPGLCFGGGASTDGDPHVKTWSGDYFDFHGECDLALVHTTNFGGLDIHARTTQRYGYSFIETAAIRIGEDTLEVSSWGNYAFNGVTDALTGNLRNSVPKLGDYPVYHTRDEEKKSKFEIVLGNDSNITIGHFKDLVFVRVNQEAGFGQVSGLWGNTAGQKMARDHTTIMTDMNEFGQEWQVRDDEPMLFRTVRAPQYPAKCVMPSLEEKEARRLGEGVDEEAAKMACDHLKSNEQEFANCVYDVTATNDLELADGGAF